MIISDAAMILFTFVLHHSQDLRPQRGRNSHIPVQFLVVLLPLMLIGIMSFSLAYGAQGQGPPLT